MDVNGTGGNGGGLSRRRLLGALGAGGVLALGSPRAGTPFRTTSPVRPVAGPSPQNFGRLFELPPFAEDDDDEQVRSALIELGAAGGLLDARDPLGRVPRS
jgi:hypothetical protein